MDYQFQEFTNAFHLKINRAKDSSTNLKKSVNKFNLFIMKEILASLKNVPGTKIKHPVIHTVYEIDEINSALKLTPIVIFKTSDTSLEMLGRVAALFGGAKDNDTFNQVRDINPQETLNKSIAHSMDAHPPHTDGTFMKNILSLFMLQCVVPDLHGGGDGLYWPIEPLISKMPFEFFEVLCEVDIEYGRLREDAVNHDYYRGKMIFEFEGKICLRWRYDTQVWPVLFSNVDNNTRHLYQQAINWILTYLMQPSNCIVRPYQRGDIAIVKNLEVLHGRTPLITSDRLMRRAWLNL